jgi:hypothetical protein
VANFLKSYTLTLVYDKWESEQIPALKRYAAGKAGATLRPDSNVTQQFGAACTALFDCSAALLWHAIQAALGNAKPQPHGKAKPVTPLATHREFEKLVKGGKHVHMGTPPVMLIDYFELDENDEDYDPKVARELDKEISESEFKIVRHLLLQGHAPDAVEAALREFGPALNTRKRDRAATYTAETVQRAIADKQLKKWRAEHQSAQSQAQSVADSGTSWLDFWRRSVAYDYWSCRMLRHSGRRSNWLLDLTNTMAFCLVLGWADYALTLYHDVAERLERKAFEDYDAGKKPFFQRRTQYFILRLIADWQGLTAPPMPPQADDEPLFAALLAQWRSPNVEALVLLLLAACDRHTQLVIVRKDSPDFDTGGELTYLPFEILAVFRLRAMLSLPNPKLDHPLMATTLGALPPVTEPYSDALLEDVLRQARMEFAEL